MQLQGLHPILSSTMQSSGHICGLSGVLTLGVQVKGIQRNSTAYSAVIRACEQGANALQIFSYCGGRDFGSIHCPTLQCGVLNV